LQRNGFEAQGTGVQQDIQPARVAKRLTPGNADALPTHAGELRQQLKNRISRDMTGRRGFSSSDPAMRAGKIADTCYCQRQDPGTAQAGLFKFLENV
jgi:hypothetical protein